MDTIARSKGRTDKVNPVYPPSNFIGQGGINIHEINESWQIMFDIYCSY